MSSELEKQNAGEPQASRVDSVSSGSTDASSGFHDREISVRDWAARNFASPGTQFVDYLKSLFPIATWIYRYNLTWLTGDVRVLFRSPCDPNTDPE